MAQKTSRLNEILAVLNRHQLYKGLTPIKLREIFEDLGGTYVKLGQILSMRTDMLDKDYCAELSKLRAEAVAMPLDAVMRVLETSGHTSLELFSQFDSIPLGSASIAQAHLATLFSGERVVVKVQREGVFDKMKNDITLLKKAVNTFRLSKLTGDVLDFNMLLDELWNTTKAELDFTCEAQNLAEYARLNSDVKFVTCPAVFSEYTTDKVLVMEYIDGIDIDNREALLSAGYNTKEIATKLVYNYIKQILTDGFFHADPHQGNLKIRDGKIVWFDFGMIGRISERDRKLLSNAMKAAVDNDIPAIKNVMKTMGNCNAPIDDIALTSDIEMIFNKYASASLAELDIAQILTEMLSIAKKHRISLPSGITMLGRGIATIEGLIASLDPETSFTDVISGYVKSEAIDNFDIKAELQETLTNLYRSGKNSANLPQSIFSALKTYQSGQTKMSIETHNSPTENKNSDKRNKLLSGSILSGLLFTGASIVMLNQSLPTYWGLPVMSWIGYLSSLAILVGAYIDNRRKK